MKVWFGHGRWQCGSCMWRVFGTAEQVAPGIATHISAHHSELLGSIPLAKHGKWEWQQTCDLTPAAD